MKKTLVTAFVCLLSYGIGHAQTEKGRFMLGLHNFSPILPEYNLAPMTTNFGISFGSAKTKVNGVESDGTTKYFNLGLNGSAHYFVANNLSLGLNLSMFNQNFKMEEDGEEDKFRLTLLMAGPDLRYFFDVSPKAKVWLRGNGSFGRVKSSFNGEEDDDSTKISTFGGGTGLAFFPNQHFSVDIGLGYSVFKSKEESEILGTSRTFEETRSGLNLDLGFSAFF